MTDAVTLLTKMYPEGITPGEYARIVTLVREIAAPAAAPRPPVVAAPPAAPKRRPSRPAKKPPATPARRAPSSPSKPAMARDALADGPMTADALAKAIGGTSNVHMLIKAIGAEAVGADPAGKKLYGLPGLNGTPAPGGQEALAAE
jgi:hypothetical protein